MNKNITSLLDDVAIYCRKLAGRSGNTKHQLKQLFGMINSHLKGVEKDRKFHKVIYKVNRDYFIVLDCNWCKGFCVELKEDIYDGCWSSHLGNVWYSRLSPEDYLNIVNNIPVALESFVVTLKKEDKEYFEVSEVITNMVQSIREVGTDE